MALVWNTTAGIVILQYYVVFDDAFTTVKYMESGTIPPNWEDIVKYLSEISTSKDINFLDTWLNGPPRSVGAKDQISDPFDVMTYHHKRQKTNTTGSSPPNPNPISAHEGNSSTPSKEEKLS